MSKSFCALIAIILTGCGAGSGAGLDANGRPGGAADSGPLIATFKSIQDNVFTPACTSCHAGSAAPLGLRLESGASYALLVNVPSSQESGVLRVAPGDPDNSYLVQKLEGTAGSGARMPLGAPPLPQATIDFIREWIAAGALSGDEGGPALPPVVVSITPEADSVSTALPATIQVIFSAPMDASLFGPTTVELLAAGGDGTFGDGNETTVSPVSIELSATNPAILTIDLAGITGGDDDYRLTLVASGATGIAGIDGQLLDGDGDEVAGGDYMIRFAVSSIEPTLESIQANVFTPTCATSGCHTGPAGLGLPAGQDLSSASASFASLVNVASEQVPSLLRVAPGDATNSYLMQKLKGEATVGGQMPLGGNPLPWPTIDVIRDWINAGAPFEGDASAPAVELNDPGSPLSGTVTLSAVAVDDVAVTSVEFRVDAITIAIDDAEPWSVEWDSNTVANGNHALDAIATDAAGNSTTSAAVMVAVDNTPPDTIPPTVTITAPAAAEVGGLVTVAANAGDDVAVAEVRFTVDGLQLGTDTTAPYAIDWDTTLFADGLHTLGATAVDTSGNSTDAATRQVTVNNAPSIDETAPTVSLTAPSTGPVSGLVPVAADASDDTGVTEVRFFAGIDFIAADATAPYGANWDSSTAADGEITLTAEASDAAGNVGFSAPVSVTVDNTAPTVTSIDPANGASLSALPATITLVFSEAMDGATVNPSTLMLEASGGDGTFGDGNEVAVVPTGVSATAADTAEIDLSGIASMDETYQVTATDGLADINGLALDGDGNGTAGGTFTAIFTVSSAPTYTADVQPIFEEKCAPCHTGFGIGGHDIGSVYTDAFLPADNSDCDGLNVGQCTIVRIQSGEMPQGAGCSGDPTLDAGNPSCLTQSEQDTVQAWIDAGLPE